ncbi:MAG: DUF1828 domain-containing protein, partial [Methanosarcinaceae archaeon]|nr:DUF1828 domain-containing protein [Methanosarcinaceae archaeon]
MIHEKLIQIKTLDNGVFEITVPFLDRHNDYLQFYVIKNSDVFTITDGGNTFDELRLRGIEISKVLENVDKAVCEFNVEIVGKEIKKSTTADNFLSALNDLIQAVLAVDRIEVKGL